MSLTEYLSPTVALSLYHILVYFYIRRNYEKKGRMEKLLQLMADTGLLSYDIFRFLSFLRLSYIFWLNVSYVL